MLPTLLGSSLVLGEQIGCTLGELAGQTAVTSLVHQELLIAVLRSLAVQLELAGVLGRIEAEAFREADGLVAASPVYYASANATLVAFLDRLFYSTGFDKRMKVGASVVVARRGGCSATFDELNKYFTISGMPVASSHYWNSVHGRVPGEAAQDLEGIATVRNLAKNMTFLMKSIALGKAQFGLPELDPVTPTHFIR